MFIVFKQNADLTKYSQVAPGTPFENLTADRRLKLLETFATLSKPADFAHADALEKQLDLSLKSSATSRLATIMEFTKMTRERPHGGIEGLLPDMARTRDLFRLGINTINECFEPEGLTLPNGVTDERLREFLSFFQDYMTTAEPHVLFRTHMYDVLAGLEIEDDVLEKKASPDFTLSTVRAVHEALAERLGLGPAAISFAKDKFPGLFASDATPIFTEGSPMPELKWKALINRDLKLADAIASAVSLTCDMYQATAAAALGNYLVDIQNADDGVSPVSKIEEKVRAAALASGRELPFLARMAYTSEEFRFYGLTVGIAGHVFPASIPAKPDDDHQNPRRIELHDLLQSTQSFLLNMSKSVQDYKRNGAHEDLEACRQRNAERADIITNATLSKFARPAADGNGIPDPGPNT